MTRLAPMLPVSSLAASITFYDMQEFRLDDPDGNRLWIGQERKAAAPGRS